MSIQRLIALIMSISLVLSVRVGLAAPKYQYLFDNAAGKVFKVTTDDKWEFMFFQGQGRMACIGYKGSNVHVTLPAEVDDYPVMIGNMNLPYGQIERFEIPEYYDEISSDMFGNVSTLKAGCTIVIYNRQANIELPARLCGNMRFVFSGYSGSTAQEYARQNGLPFVAIDNKGSSITPEATVSVTDAPDCQHEYSVHRDKPVSGSGVWTDNGDGTHKRTEIKYKQFCSKCGVQGPNRVVYNDILSEVHNLDKTGVCMCGYKKKEETLNKKQKELWKKMTSRDNVENSYLFLGLPKYTFQEMKEGGWLENFYVGSYSQYSQVVDSWFDYSTSGLVLDKMYNYINKEEYANEAFAQMIVEYIRNFDAESAYDAATYEEKAKALAEIIDGLSNQYAVAEIVQMLMECPDGPETCIEFFIGEKLGIGTVTGIALGMTEELIEQYINKCKGRIVRMKIEEGIGNIDSLPYGLRKEINAFLDKWEDGWAIAGQTLFAGIQKLYVVAIDSVIEYSLNAAGTAIGFPVLGKLLVGIKNGIGQAVDSAHIKEIGLGIEYILISKEMVKHAEAELLQAARDYASNPTVETYALLIKKKDAYRTYAGAAIYWYYAWSVLEAEHDISNWLPGGQNAETLKASAKLTYENDMNKLNGYVSGI